MQNVVEAPARVATLESALATTEHDAEAAVTAAARLLAALKAAHAATRTGDLKALHKARETANDAMSRATEAVTALDRGWQLTESQQEAYLASSDFTRELLATAAQTGVNLFEQETVLACYPSLVKVQPKDRSVLIDRKTYRPIRPSHLVAHLSSIQKKAPKLNVPQFLETLYSAWKLLNQKRGGMEKLLDIYTCLTLMPTFRQEYSQQEFARDVYLLDAAGLNASKEGVQFRLHPGATGAKTRSNLLIVVTREGVERNYYSIEFFT